MKQNQGKTLCYEMRMPRKLLFQVSYFSHCVYTFDTDSSEGNLQNTYCIKMFENFFMCYSIFGIILFHIFRNAQHFKFLWFKRFVRIRFDLMCQIMFVLPRVLKPFYNMSSIAAYYKSLHCSWVLYTWLLLCYICTIDYTKLSWNLHFDHAKLLVLRTNNVLRYRTIVQIVILA